MALVKLEDFDPNYREAFDGNDIKGMRSILKEVMRRLVQSAML